MRCLKRWLVVLTVASCVSAGSFAADLPEFRRTRDVVYGRKHGMALTMDVFTPAHGANGAGVVMVISGGWVSAHAMINPAVFAVFLERGYTVFAVVHGSQPKFTIPEVMDDMHRAVRFIRHHAKEYGLDADWIGITGGSAGGHLSLMIGTAGCKGDPKAQDPVDQGSSRVQAVGCYFPPTDFLNYGAPDRDILQALEAELGPFKAPFDFVELNGDRQFVRIEDRQRRLEIAKQISPVTHVTADDPPSLIIHGDADKLVPIQQTEAIQRRFKKVGVPFRLVVRQGQGHGWKNWIADMALIADFFDEHRLAWKPAPQPG